MACLLCLITHGIRLIICVEVALAMFYNSEKREQGSVRCFLEVFVRNRTRKIPSHQDHSGWWEDWFLRRFQLGIDSCLNPTWEGTLHTVQGTKDCTCKEMIEWAIR